MDTCEQYCLCAGLVSLVLNEKVNRIGQDRLNGSECADCSKHGYTVRAIIIQTVV